MQAAFKDTLKQVAGGAARTLVATLAGTLVTAGWIAGSKTVAFEDAAIGVLGVVGILAWSAGEKLWVYVKQELAKIPKDTPAGVVITAIEDAADDPEVQAAVAAEADKLGAGPLTTTELPGYTPAPFKPMIAGHPLV